MLGERAVPDLERFLNLQALSHLHGVERHWPQSPDITNLPQLSPFIAERRPICCRRAIRIPDQRRVLGAFRRNGCREWMMSLWSQTNWQSGVITSGVVHGELLA